MVFRCRSWKKKTSTDIPLIYAAFWSNKIPNHKHFLNFHVYPVPSYFEHCCPKTLSIKLIHLWSSGAKQINFSADLIAKCSGSNCWLCFPITEIYGHHLKSALFHEADSFVVIMFVLQNTYLLEISLAGDTGVHRMADIRKRSIS